MVIPYRNYTFTLYALSERLETIFRLVNGFNETELIPDYVFIDSNITKATDFLGYIDDYNLMVGNASLHCYYTR